MYFLVLLLSVIPTLSKISETLGYNPVLPFTYLCNILLFNNCYVQILWFLYVLLFIYLINYFIKSQNLINIVTVILVILISVVTRSLFQPPYIISKLIRHFPNFLFGRYLCKLSSYDNKKLQIISIITIVITVIVYGLDSFYIQGIVIHRLIEMFTGLSAFILLYWLVHWIDKCKVVKDILAYIGNHTMSIYLIHHTYVVGIIAVLGKIFNINVNITVIICFISALSIPIVIELLLCRYAPFIAMIAFGKNIKEKKNVNN